jgi:hypothetical protein
MNYRRLALPIALLTFGVALLQGCLFIPTFNKVQEGENVTKKIGDSGSRKPIRFNRATRADVERVFGPPNYASADGLRVAYSWRVLEGVWVMPLCFAVEDQRGQRAAVLTFDDGGVLRSMGVVKVSNDFMHATRIESALPRDLRPKPIFPAPQPSPPPSSGNDVPPPPPGSRYDTTPSP